MREMLETEMFFHIFQLIDFCSLLTVFTGYISKSNDLFIKNYFE